MRQVIILIMLALWPLVTGTTYYVNGNTGNDSNLGSSAQPWKTIQRALPNYAGSPQVAAGDTVKICALDGDANYGQITYDEGGDTGRSSWIVYEANDTENMPIITTLTIPATTNVYMKWSYIHFNNAVTDITISLLGTFDGEYKPLIPTTHVQFLNCYINHDFIDNEDGSGDPGFKIMWADNITIDNCEVAGGQPGFWIEFYATNITVSNSNCHHSFGDLITVERTNAVLIENNEIHHVDVNLISESAHWDALAVVDCNNIIVRGNTFHDIGYSQCLYTVNDYGTDCTNITYENNLVYTLAQEVGTDIIKLYEVDGLVFRNNTIIALQLAAGSMAIGFGDPDYAPATDILGNARDAQPDAGAYEYGGVVDATAPVPNPATFASVPTAASSSSITMTATAASDAGGSTPVEYYFNETSGNSGGTDSSWQASTTYTDTGLSELTQYTYTVQTRDSIPNTGTASGGFSATTLDGTAPTPDPATFSSDPQAVDSNSITMTATTAVDAGGSTPVEYYFDETSNNFGGTDSGWQQSATYTDGWLSSSTQYAYRVRTRDSLGNTGTYSSGLYATTDAMPADPCDDDYSDPETDPPVPNPSTWTAEPSASGTTNTVTMTCTEGSDVSTPVEYFFNETSGNAGGSNSEWQADNTYTDTGLAAGTQYTYRVRSRDGLRNTGSWSSSVAVTTEAITVVAEWRVELFRSRFHEDGLRNRNRF